MTYINKYICVKYLSSYFLSKEEKWTSKENWIRREKWRSKWREENFDENFETAQAVFNNISKPEEVENWPKMPYLKWKRVK